MYDKIIYTNIGSDSNTDLSSDSDFNTDSAEELIADDEEGYNSEDSENPGPYKASKPYTVREILAWIRKERIYDEDELIEYPVEYPDLDCEDIVERTFLNGLEELITNLLEEERSSQIIKYSYTIKELVARSNIKIAGFDSVEENLAIAVKKNEIEIIKFYVQEGVYTDLAILAATSSNAADSEEMLALLKAEVEKHYVISAINNENDDALAYFLKVDFATSSEFILPIAAEQSNIRLVELVCSHAEIEYVYDLITCLIKNGGESLIVIFFDYFDFEELLTEVQEQDSNRDLYQVVLITAEKYLLEQTSFTQQAVNDRLEPFFQKLKATSTLLCYPKDSFQGDPLLAVLRQYFAKSIRLSLEQRTAANFIGVTFSTANRYITPSPYHSHPSKEAEKYFRSAHHPLSVFVTPQLASYEPHSSLPEQKANKGYGNEAHLGLYKNTLDSMNTMNEIKLPQKNAKKLINTHGNAALYNKLLHYKHSVCHYIAKKCSFNNKEAIKVGFYNKYPCVMVLIKRPGWVEIAISYFVGLVNYKAQLNGLDIELVRRPGFGFLSPTIAPCDESFRISIGIVPTSYADVLIECLNILKNVLTILNGDNCDIVQKKINIELPTNCFISTEKYKKYIGKKTLNNQINNILQLTDAKIDKGGKTGAYNLMRTVMARDGFTEVVFNRIYESKPNSYNDYTNILLDGLRWGFSNLNIESSRIKFKQDFSIKFKQLKKTNKTVNDERFFTAIAAIVKATEDVFSLEKNNKFLNKNYRTLIIDIKRIIQNKVIEGLYYNLELLNELLYTKAIISSKIPEEDDGYGSDSEVEESANSSNMPALYGKKVILHNGMRAILAALHAGADFLFKDYLTTSKKHPLFLHGAYCETANAMKLLSKFNAITDLSKIQNAKLMIYDINACGKKGEKLPIPTDQQLSGIRVLIIDSTSATIEKYNFFIRKFLQQPKMEALIYVPSGFKNEQMGSDKNSYGTVRIFTKDKSILDRMMAFIKNKENPILSHISHTHRRIMKCMGNVPSNSAIVNPMAYKQKAKKETHNNLRLIPNNIHLTSKLVPQHTDIPQSFFLKTINSTELNLPRHYSIQINQQPVAFEVREVESDGDCGYTAFGIIRMQAYRLLVENIAKIRDIIKPALQEALRTQTFIDALINQGRLTKALSQAYANYVVVSKAGGEIAQAIIDALDRAGDELTILHAYIDYDVKDKQIDAGWSHPCILFALAEIQSIELHIWQRDEQRLLVAHPNYPQHSPAKITQRTDLLFVNGNHFERLEPIDDLNFTFQKTYASNFQP